MKAIMPKKNPKKSKPVKPSDYMRLYKAVQEYVETRGGKIIVAGGVGVIEWPNDSEFNFTIGIRCTGRKPVFKSP